MAALSLASDLAIGLPAEHAVRSCYIGMHIADQLQLSSDQQVDLYYAQLLMDAGCTAWTSQLAGFILNDEIAARRDPHAPITADNVIEYMASGASTLTF